MHCTLSNLLIYIIYKIFVTFSLSPTREAFICISNASLVWTEDLSLLLMTWLLLYFRNKVPMQLYWRYDIHWYCVDSVWKRLLYILTPPILLSSIGCCVRFHDKLWWRWCELGQILHLLSCLLFDFSFGAFINFPSSHKGASCASKIIDNGLYKKIGTLIFYL